MIGLVWDQGSNNGGAEIIDYRLSYKVYNSGDDFAVLTSTVTSSSYSTDALSQGESYVFKVEARNSFGYSHSASNQITVLQA